MQNEATILKKLLCSGDLPEKLWLLIGKIELLTPDLLDKFLHEFKTQIPSLTEDRIKELASVYLEANILLQKHNPKQARPYQQKTIATLEELVQFVHERFPQLSQQLRCNILTTKAQIERSAGDLESAELLIRDAVKIAKEIDDPVRLTNALHIWSFIERDKRVNATKTESLFKEALSASEHVENKMDQLRYQASILNNMATFYFYSGNPAESFRILDEIFKISSDNNHPLLLDTLAVAYGNSGLYYYDAGDMKSALSVLVKSDELARKTGNTEQIVRNYINRGIFLNEMGMIEESIESLQKALEINEQKTANLEYEVAIHKVLAEVYRAQHSYELALEQNHLAQEQSFAHDNLIIHWAESVQHEGTIYTELNQLDRAEDCYLTALSRLRDLNQTENTGYFNAMIAYLRLKLKRNDFKKVESDLKALIDKVEVRGLDHYKLMAMNCLAELYYKEKDWEKALQTSKQIKEMSSKGNNLLLQEILYRNAKILYEMKSFSEAVTIIEPMASSFLASFGDIPSLDYLINTKTVGTIPGLRKTELINTNLPFLELLVDCYLGKNDYYKALSILTAVKETYFSDIMASTDLFSANILADKEFAAKLREIRILESSLNSLDSSSDPQLTAVRSATFTKYREESQSLRAELISRYSKLKKRVSQKKKFLKTTELEVNFEQAFKQVLQNCKLSSDTAVLEYYYSEQNDLIAFLVSVEKTDLKVEDFKQSTNRSDLNRALKALREKYDEISTRLIRGKAPFGGLSSTSVIGQHQRRLRELSNTLFDSVSGSRRFKKVKKLIVIPYRDLSAVNLASLRLPAEHYLVEQKVINYLPVLSLSRLMTTKQQKEEDNIISFIGMEGSGNHVVDEFKSLCEMAGSSKFMIKGGLSKGLALNDFITQAMEADILHFSGHGHVDSQKPWLSYLDLGQSRLLVEDALIGRIPHHDWDLVFLNGCQTALPGQDDLGLYSLASAFLACGAQNVIATLWRIEDEAAAIFSKIFYKHYFQHRNPGHALALTQRDFIKGNLLGLSEKRIEELKHPYYWASYICIGMP